MPHEVTRVGIRVCPIETLTPDEDSSGLCSTIGVQTGKVIDFIHHCPPASESSCRHDDSLAGGQRWMKSMALGV